VKIESATGRLEKGRIGDEDQKHSGVCDHMASFSALAGTALAQQDKYRVKALNGVAFSEFRGHETCQDVAASETDDGLKVILGNSVMINAYKEGIPGNGKPFPEGSMIVKIEWSKKDNPISPTR